VKLHKAKAIEQHQNTFKLLLTEILMNRFEHLFWDPKYTHELNTPKKLITVGVITFIFGIYFLVLLIMAMTKRFDILALVLALIPICLIIYFGGSLLYFGIGLKLKNPKILKQYNKRKPININTRP
jgi:hypothetical protein